MPVVRSVVPVVLAAAFLAPPSHARADEAPPLTGASFMELDAMLPSLRGRPNEEFRVQGLKAYQQRHFDEAIARLQSALALVPPSSAQAAAVRATLKELGR